MYKKASPRRLLCSKISTSPYFGIVRNIAAAFTFPLLPPRRRRMTTSTRAEKTMCDTVPAVELTAPNGVKYSQPTGLFINNKFVKSSQEKKLLSIDPA